MVTLRLTCAVTQAAVCCLVADAATSSVASLAGVVLSAAGVAELSLARAKASTAIATTSTAIMDVSMAAWRDGRLALPIRRSGSKCRCAHSRSVVAITFAHEGSGSGRPSLLTEPPPRPRWHDNTVLTALVHHNTACDHRRSRRFR